MIRGLRKATVVAAMWAGLVSAGHAETAPHCAGRDLMASLTPEQSVKIAQSVASAPYSTGVRWTATRGPARIEMIGTFHFDDPRHEGTVQSLRPILAEADALLVEAGPQEEAALQNALARDPSLMVDTDGPTLVERLGPDDWAAVTKAMGDRGMPPIMVAKLRPWYLSMMLGLSPCMLAQARAAGDIGGLDHRLVAEAQAAGVPVRALEPWDTVFTLFSDLSDEDELDMIRATLPAAALADDYATTTIEAYFRGDIWAIWEFGRIDALARGDMDPAAVDRQMALAEDRMMARRNASWIEPLTRAADAAAVRGKPVVAAFGALHLPGTRGVLRLLEQDGWTITKGMAQ